MTPSCTLPWLTWLMFSLAYVTLGQTQPPMPSVPSARDGSSGLIPLKKITNAPKMLFFYEIRTNEVAVVRDITDRTPSRADHPVLSSSKVIHKVVVSNDVVWYVFNGGTNRVSRETVLRKFRVRETVMTLTNVVQTIDE